MALHFEAVLSQIKYLCYILLVRRRQLLLDAYIVLSGRDPDIAEVL